MTAVVLCVPSVSLLNGASLADRKAEFPRLAWCLGAATRTPHAGPLEPLLIARCGLDPAAALAQITARYDLGAAAAARDLLRCDPIHLHADPNKVLVYGPASLDVSAADADALIAAVQREFPALNCERGTSPQRWYIARPPDVAGIAPSTQWLNARSITPFMPLAAAQRSWRRWLNDLQMVLHEQPVNQAREARGLLPVNGVWWFGAGVSPEVTSCAFTQLIGNDAVLAGIAAHTKIPWSAHAAPALATRGATLVVAGTAFGEALAGNVISLPEIETAWLPSLINALRRRHITSLTLLTATHSARISWFQSWRTWHAPQSFILE